MKMLNEAMSSFDKMSAEEKQMMFQSIKDITLSVGAWLYAQWDVAKSDREFALTLWDYVYRRRKSHLTGTFPVITEITSIGQLIKHPFYADQIFPDEEIVKNLKSLPLPLQELFKEGGVEWELFNPRTRIVWVK